jgi:SAM-dependent methyltransferase
LPQRLASAFIVPMAGPGTPIRDDRYGRITAPFYDSVYRAERSRAADVAFYLELAREAAGPVLELGCGTGRVLLEIAAAGFPCTGLDVSAAMLTALRKKPFPPSLRLVCSQMQSFDLGGDRFMLIYSAFRAFQHLYTVEDQLACLRQVRRHLAPGGVFAFDVFNPRLARTALREEPETEDLRFELEGNEVVRYATVQRDHAAQLLHLTRRYETRRGAELLSSETVVFQLRYFFRFELEHLLARAGFADVQFYGDFQRSPLTAENGFVIVAHT